jgi:hypothetical protein
MVFPFRWISFTIRHSDVLQITQLAIASVALNVSVAHVEVANLWWHIVKKRLHGFKIRAVALQVLPRKICCPVPAPAVAPMQ